MSYLSELIKAILPTLGGPAPALNTAMNGFKTAITDTLGVLSNDDNLRIYDDQNGGAVRGPKQSRQANHCEDENGVLSCNIKKFCKCDEVTYFRAVFNLPVRSFNLTANSEVRLIGYESPLMRKVTDRRNVDIISRNIACDLVGLTSDNQVLCIEGKVRPHKQDTNIVYGLLESFAYGVCVEYFLSDNIRRASFMQEVQFCLSDFHGQAGVLKDDALLTAAFSLAAPRKYFAEYFKPTKDGTDRACRNRIVTVKNQLQQAGQLLAAFQAIGGPAWAGFMIMEPPCTVSSFDKRNGRTIAGKEYCEPHFKPKSFRVGLAANIAALKQAVESSS